MKQASGGEPQSFPTASVAESTEIDISIYNTSAARFIPRQRMRRAIEHVLTSHKQFQASVSVVLVDDREMRRINKKFLNHDYTTDVISFSLEDDVVDGELYVCADVARRQAAEYGVSFSRELMRLVAHGALHLVGYDDADAAGRSEMSRLEDESIAAAW